MTKLDWNFTVNNNYPQSFSCSGEYCVKSFPIYCQLVNVLCLNPNISNLKARKMI